MRSLKGFIGGPVLISPLLQKVSRTGGTFILKTAAGKHFDLRQHGIDAHQTPLRRVRTQK